MAYLLALLETTVGEIALERFSSKSGMSESAMRAELLVNPPLAAYFVQICRTAIDDVKGAA